MKQKIEGRLAEILKKMDIPPYRVDDVGWLSRNLGVRNSKHPDFREAMALLKPLASKEMKKNEVAKCFSVLES